MPRVWFWSVLLLLAGCGGGEVFDTRYDETAPSGLRVRYANDLPPRIDLIDAMYRDVAACMGIIDLPAGPLVAIEEGLHARTGNVAFIRLPEFIFVDASITIPDWTDPATILVYGGNFKHEMVHYLGHKVFNWTETQQLKHDSPFFFTCGVPR